MRFYYQVIRGILNHHVSVSDHSTLTEARGERDRWNTTYQTDEYRILATDENGRRSFVR